MALFDVLVKCGNALTMAGVLATAPALAGTVSGIGSRDCEAFMRAVEINSREAVDAYVAWGQGYVSGYNWANPNAKDVAIDGTGLSYWLMEYCENHRSTTFFEAMQALIADHTR